MMGFLALYDASGIQKYIYNSNRLRDNRGASIAVAQCFDTYLINAIKKVESNVVCNWKENENAVFGQDKKVECEVIYIGGGNAQIYFKTKELYIKVNREFSKYLLEEMPGVTIVSEIIDMNSCKNYDEAVNRLFKKLQLKKQQGKGLMSAPCLSVTRECNYTREPAVALGEDGRWISEEIVKKREKAVQEFEKEDYKETDQMAGKVGEQWIATIHIDGNDMGSHIHKILEEMSLEDGIPRIRRFSKKIREIYDEAYKQMTQDCKECIKKSRDSRLELYKENPPFRKIYGAGDDLTFICYGPLALKAAEIFIRNVAGHLVEDVELSACAGIAYSKPGYPFYKAYMIAEQCCKSAKTEARMRQKGKEVLGNYIDFQIVRGSQNSLHTTRKNDYFKEGYNLLLRPYAVLVKENVEYSMKKDDLQFFYAISNYIASIDSEGEKKIARSKMKELRNAYYIGKENAETVISLIRRRSEHKWKELEKIIEERGAGNTSPCIDNDQKAVLFDALEMMDIYIQL